MIPGVQKSLVLGHLTK